MVDQRVRSANSQVNFKMFSSMGEKIIEYSNIIFYFSFERNIRSNVEYDHAVKVRFSPDSRSFIASLGNSNTIRAFKITKKDDSSNLNIMQAAIQDFPQVNIGFFLADLFSYIKNNIELYLIY